MDYLEVVFVVVPLQSKWIVTISLNHTLQENLKLFFEILKEELKDDFLYSEQLQVIDESSFSLLNPFVLCRKLNFHCGHILFIL